MADKLAIYNLTLGHLRERRIRTLTENREPRRVLDDFWDQVVAECLEEGLWNFMTRVIQADASASVVPAFGWSYAFTIPTDFVRTVIVSTVETLSPPLLDYAEETGYWYANFTPIYISYLSNDVAYGRDMSRWTANFTAYVAFKLAEYACGRVTGSDSLLKGPEGIIKRCYRAKIKAKSNDAMNQAPGQFPTGTWVLARRGNYRNMPLPGGSGYDD